MRSKIGLVLLTLTIAACSSSGNGGPMTPGNGNEDFLGTYEGVHRFLLSIGTIGDGIECPASLTVSSVDGNQFSGTVSIGDCPLLDLEAASGPMMGTISDSGAIVILLDEDDLLALAQLAAELGCVVVDSEDRFTGAFSGTTIEISFSADLECADVAGEVVFTWEIEATET